MQIPQQVFDFLRSEPGTLLREDTICWAAWHKVAYAIPDGDIDLQFSILFERFPEFRSLYDFRTIGSSIYRLLLREKPRATDLNINAGSIGPRCRIQHGHGTYLLAREVGADFFIGHLVTVGAHGGIPKIGDNVMIRTGAVVVGAIEIGDNCRIAANSVVTRSMPKGFKAYPPQTTYKPG